MRIAKTLVGVIFLSCLLMAQGGNPKPEVPAKPGTKTTPPKRQTTRTPAKEEPQRIIELRGMDPLLIDKAVDPCVDFYQYSCGGWLKANPVPSDQATYGRDTELAERNRLVLRDILEKTAIERADRSPVEQKLATFTLRAWMKVPSSAKAKTRSSRSWTALPP